MTQKQKTATPSDNKLETADTLAGNKLAQQQATKASEALDAAKAVQQSQSLPRRRTGGCGG